MADTKKKVDRKEVDLNEDPITNAHGAHPVGVGIGAAAGGAATGAVAGAVAGPVGAVVGAVVGGVAGGLAGKAIAEEIDPTVERAYWEGNYRDRDYVDADREFQTYEPAYQYGWESRSRHETDDFAAVEKELERDWEVNRGSSDLDWKSARPASKDAWDRATREYSKEN